MEKKKRIEAFDLIRAFCTIGIVLFHYSFNYIEFGINGSHLVFARFTNGNWGGTFVAVFFMLSGAVLWYNYGDRMRTGHFYYRRWLSIFPMFYLAWFFAYLKKVNELKNWLWAGPRSVFLWSVFGVDGYFYDPYTNPNYFVVGEWFLGAILMLYAVFPLLRLIFRRNRYTGTILRYVFTAVLLVLYTMNLYSEWGSISDGKHALTCITDFWLGMLIMELHTGLSEKSDRFKNVFTALCALAALFVMAGPLPEPKEVMVSTLAAVFLTLVFLRVGECLMRLPALAFFCQKISKWSFGIFLVHHVMLYDVMGNLAHADIDLLQSIVLFIMIMVIICIAGALLTQWGKWVTEFAEGIRKAVFK